jgi:PPOX class probable F420-dependent enzyme
MNEKQRAFAAQPHVAVLATVGPSGEPQAVPVWYFSEDDTFLINTDRGSQKHRNVERDPRVSLVIDKREPPFYALMVHGEAQVEAAFTEEKRFQLYVRYLGEEMARQFVGGGGAERVSLRIKPTKVIEFDPTG